MEYDVVHDSSHADFMARVNQKLSEGWEPLGGINVCPEYEDGKLTGFLLYSQAIMKR
jgi:hypothetical protein